MARGARLIATGLPIALVAAFASTRFLASHGYGVSSVDWKVDAAVTLPMLIVSLAACHLPARRASKLDPMTTLRLECVPIVVSTRF
jgi:ABC-type lipoprotein release transport system permease subunit